MKYSSPLPKTTMALAVWLALDVGASYGAMVGGGQQSSSTSSEPCIDQQSGNPITTGLCNKALVVSLAVVLSSLFVVALAIVVWLKFRRRRTDAKRMAELGIDVKLSPSMDKPLVVKVKLPGLSVFIPPGKVAGEMPRPDSIVTPTPFHVGQ